MTLLLKGPDGRKYIADWTPGRESWLVTEFGPRVGSDVLPSEWWDKEARNQWGRSQTYDTLEAFTVLAYL